MRIPPNLNPTGRLLFEKLADHIYNLKVLSSAWSGVSYRFDDEYEICVHVDYDLVRRRENVVAVMDALQEFGLQWTIKARRGNISFKAWKEEE